MRRIDLMRHLEAHGCYVRREGGNHTVYTNPANGHSAPVPRHREISNLLARAICRQLGIPDP